MDNVTSYRILVTASGVLPQLEFFITKPVKVEAHNKTRSKIARFSSYSYKFTKLPNPYVDNCMDYKQLGYMNRFDTISSCITNVTTRKRVIFKVYSNTKIITRNMINLHNYTLFRGINRPTHGCYQKYQKDDCNLELTYTDHETVLSYASSEYAT